MSGHASFQSVRLCHCRGTLGISFVDTPSLPTGEEGGREGDKHFPTPHIGLFSEGGAGIVTDKQQRRKRGALSRVATWIHTFIESNFRL